MRELDQPTIENGFPVDVFDDLLIKAEMEYQHGVKEYGPGKNWLNDDPRYHIYKAVDEMMQSRGDTHEYEYNEYIKHLSKAMLHAMMAGEIIKNDEEWQK